MTAKIKVRQVGADGGPGPKREAGETPLPIRPEDMEGIEKHAPGITLRVFEAMVSMGEKAQNHRHEQEKERAELERDLSVRGQWLAGGLTLFLMVITAGAVWVGAYIPAGLMCTAIAIGIAGVLGVGRSRS